jgi:hypothetical protein
VLVPTPDPSPEPPPESPPEPPPELPEPPDPPPQAATEAEAAPTPSAAASRINVSREIFSKASSSSPADNRIYANGAAAVYYGASALEIKLS